MDPQVAHDLAMESLRQHYEEEFSVSLKSFATSSVILFGAAILGMLLPGIESAIGAGLTAMVVVCQTDDSINIKKGLSRLVDNIRSRKIPDYLLGNIYAGYDFERSDIQWDVMNELADSNNVYSVGDDNLPSGELIKNSIDLARYSKYGDPMDKYVAFMQRALKVKAGIYLDDIVSPPDKFAGLKGYNLKRLELSKSHQGEVIYEKLLEYSETVVRGIIVEYEDARNELKEKNIAKPIQTKITKFILADNVQKISMDDPMFEKVMASPAKYGFNFYIYRWDWKGFKTTITFEGATRMLADLPYIGYTAGFKTRIESEILDAMDHYSKNQLTRLHEKAIIIALRQETEQIIRKINSIDPNSDLDPYLGDLEMIYHWYETQKGTWKAKDVINFIMSKEIIQKYFDIYIVEAYEKKDFALDGEREYTLSYMHNVDGNEVLGTIWPNGLNMKKGGGKSKFDIYDLIDIFDLIALASLGLRLTSIAEILSQVYRVRITVGILSNKLKNLDYDSFIDFQEFALRPVIDSLIKYALREDQIDISIRNMHTIFDFGEVYLCNRLRQWFGVDFHTLKILQRANADWDRVKEMTLENLKIFRGYSPEEVRMWFIRADIQPNFIADKLGVSRTQFKRIVKETISPFFTGRKMNSIELRQYLRKEEFIRLLQQGVAPELIFGEYFKFTITFMGNDGREYLRKSKVLKTFNDIFKNSGITFEMCINSYYNNPASILARYREKYNRIIYSDLLEGFFD